MLRPYVPHGTRWIGDNEGEERNLRAPGDNKREGRAYINYNKSSLR